MVQTGGASGPVVPAQEEKKAEEPDSVTRKNTTFRLSSILPTSSGVNRHQELIEEEVCFNPSSSSLAGADNAQTKSYSGKGKGPAKPKRSTSKRSQQRKGASTPAKKRKANTPKVAKEDNPFQKYSDKERATLASNAAEMCARNMTSMVEENPNLEGEDLARARRQMATSAFMQRQIRQAFQEFEDLRLDVVDLDTAKGEDTEEAKRGLKKFAEEYQNHYIVGMALMQVTVPRLTPVQKEQINVPSASGMVVSTLDGHITYFLWNEATLSKLPQELEEFLCVACRFILSTRCKQALEVLIQADLLLGDRVNRRRWLDLERIGHKLKLREEQKELYQDKELDWDSTEHLMFAARVYLRQDVDTTPWEQELTKHRQGGKENQHLMKESVPENKMSSAEYYGWPAVAHGLGGLTAYLNGEYTNLAFKGQLKGKDEIEQGKHLLNSFIDWLQGSYDPIKDNDIPRQAMVDDLKPFLKKICDFPPGMTYRHALETAAGEDLTFADINGLKEHRGAVSKALVQEWQQIVAKQVSHVHDTHMATRELSLLLSTDEDTSLEEWSKGEKDTKAALCLLKALGKHPESHYLMCHIYAKDKPMAFLLYFKEDETLGCIYNPLQYRAGDEQAKACLERTLAEYNRMAGRPKAHFTTIHGTNIRVCDHTEIRMDAEVLNMATLFFTYMEPPHPPPTLKELRKTVDNYRAIIARGIKVGEVVYMPNVTHDEEYNLLLDGKRLDPALQSPVRAQNKAWLDKYKDKGMPASKGHT